VLRHYLLNGLADHFLVLGDSRPQKSLKIPIIFPLQSAIAIEPEPERLLVLLRQNVSFTH
jgi:hypothetical protein